MRPLQVGLGGDAAVQYLVGWTSFIPFLDIREDGGEGRVAVGIHRYYLRSRRGLMLRDIPSLNWRSMLGDGMMHEIPEPKVEFQLFETGGFGGDLPCWL